MANELTVQINADDSGFEEGMNDLKQNLAIVSSSLIELGSSIKDTFSGALDGVFQTQKGITRFQNQTGTSINEMKKYSEEIKSLYKSGLGESINDVSEAMANVKQQSKALGANSPKDIKKITESALILRDNFEVDIPESTKTAATLMKNFGMKSSEAFDFIAKGFQDGLDQSGDFMDTMYEYSPQFSKMGLSANDMFEIIKNGTKAGIFTMDKMGDAVKEFGIRAIDGSDNTKKAFESIGLNADDMAKRLAKGGTDGQKAFFDIIEAIGKIKDPLKQNEIGVFLFGTMWEDLGGKAILGMGKAEGATNKFTGTLDKIKKNTATQDIGKQFESLKRTIEIDVVQPIAAKLLPALKKIADIGKKYLPQLKESFENIPDGIVIAIAAIGGLLSVIIPLIGMWGILAPAIAAVKAAFISAGGFIAGISAPILLAIGAIVAIIAIIYVFRDQFANVFGKIASVVIPLLLSAFSYMKTTFINTILPIINEQLPKIKNAFMSAFESIKGHLMTVIPFIVELIKGAKPAFEVIVGILQFLWQSFLMVFGNVVSFLGSTVVNIISIIKGVIVTIVGIVNIGLGILSGDWKRVWQGITSLLSGIFNIIKGLVYQGINIIKTTIGSGLQFVFSIFQRVFPNAANVVRNVWETIKNLFRSGANIVKSTVSNMLQTIKSLFDGASFKDVGKKLIDQLVSGIKSGISAVKNACKSVAKAISNFFPHSPAKEGPLRSFPETGVNLMDQLMDGIKGSQSKLSQITSNVASDINANVNSNITMNNNNKNNGITIPIYLDGRKISEVTAPYFVRALRQQGF